MRFTKRFLGVFLILFPVILTNTINAFGFETDDDYTPQVTARVARITLLNGDVQIKRNSVENWEKATNNLPLAEGDELTTSRDARIEIEFDRYNYLRLAENSYLKITTLRDGGIAVSLPQGTMVLRVSKFEKDKEFFEIDAPKTTLAVQKEGMYRIDSGDTNSSEIRLTATEKGEARIYSGNSGFTLKNGRSAKLFLSGNFEGEWETGDASRYADEFDSWVLERDAIVAKRLRDSNVDKYYDSEITGADELLENGQWIYTRKYGYVWKPYSSSISGYSNWSPYRYGHWRWFPPYGWTWVNDEPWGWATYHYGRWVWDNGGWYWSPYARNRWRRSWWSPALVIVTYSGGYYCWYPLPYHYNYYNYNAYYYNNNTTIINNNTTIINNNPTPTQTPRQDGTKTKTNLDDVPPNAVVAANPNEFGKIVKGFTSPPWNISQNVVSNAPTKLPTTPILPNYNQLDAQTTKSVTVTTPNIVKTTAPVKTGVIVRETGISMSDKIQKQKVLDDRTNAPVKVNQTTNNSVRDTGAVTRDEIIKQTQTNTQNQTDRNTTRNNPTQTNNDNNTVRSTGGGNSNQTDRNTTRNNSNNNNNQQNQTDRNTPRNPQQNQQNQTDRNTPRNQQQNQTDRNTPRNQPQQQQNNTQRDQTPRNNPQPTQQNQPTQKPREEQKPQQQPKQDRKNEQDKDG